MGRDEDTEYNCIKQIRFTVRFKENTGLQSTSENLQLAEMEIFVFFIYQMTLLVRIVGGSKLTPYDSNCSKSVCVCVFALACIVRVCRVQWCLRERTSDGATGPTAGNCGEVDKVKIAWGQMSKRRYYRPHYSHFTKSGHSMVRFSH